MQLCLAVIAAGIALRQINRLRFARRRPRTAGAAQLIAPQRARANDWTPTALLAGQWAQITGWWMLAAATWLPYGDLQQYAHSTHPRVRWNYLPALQQHLAALHFTPDGLLLGPGSVARRHLAALQAAAPASVPRPARAA
ncbi:hypothetical protein [Streptomyces sp. bgisy130]|uniref:hypothetical protein n=1 Tax=Streptomyces sp. bgisy130 TaxID=3413788 RepID=UPI003F4A49B7